MSLVKKMPADDLAWLQERAIERDGCWVWLHSCQDGCDPRAGRHNKSVAVRRYVYNATHPEPIDGKQCAVVLETCDALCVHPDHIQAASRSSRQKGRKQSRDHSLAISKAMRARSRLTPEIVSQIRASDEPGVVLARRFGIDDSYVSDIRAQRAWADHASPFAGLFTGLAANSDTARRRA